MAFLPKIRSPEGACIPIDAELMVKLLHQGIDDLIRRDTLPRSNLIDQWAPKDQPARETRRVWNILLELNDGGVDVSEAGVCQRVQRDCGTWADCRVGARASG